MGGCHAQPAEGRIRGDARLVRGPGDLQDRGPPGQQPSGAGAALRRLQRHRELRAVPGQPWQARHTCLCLTPCCVPSTRARTVRRASGKVHGSRRAATAPPQRHACSDSWDPSARGSRRLATSVAGSLALCSSLPKAWGWRLCMPPPGQASSARSDHSLSNCASLRSSLSSCTSLKFASA